MIAKTLCSFLVSSLCAFALEIVLPESPTMFERTAAEELSLHLKQAYGTDIATVGEKAATGGLAIYVGNTALAAENGMDGGRMDGEDWRVKSLDGKRIVAVGGSPRGVIYSAYELLERLYGVMWLDEHFTVFPKERLEAWPTIDVNGRPDFRIRDLHTYYSKDNKARWLVKSRNRINYFHDEENTPPFKATMQKYGIFRVYGEPQACHTYYFFTKDLPPEDEDCFSMNKSGKRVRSKSDSGPGQICFSNPKTVDVFEKKLREYIAIDRKENPDNPPCIYEVSANDNPSECYCPGCQELVKKYGSYGGAVLHFTNALAERIEKDFPEIKLQMFAYFTAAKVPTGIKARPNVLVRLAQIGSEWGGGYRDSLRSLRHPNNARAFAELDAWTKVATVSIWDYWITYRGAAPGLCLAAIDDNLPIYKEKGIESFFVEHESPMESFFYPLRAWLGFRKINRTAENLEELTRKFMYGYYGEKAAPFMSAILGRMQEEQAKVAGDLGTLPSWGRPDLSKKNFDFYDEQIVKALAAAENDDYRKHVIKERLAIDHAKLKILKGNASPDMKPFLARMLEDYNLLTTDWGGSGIPNTVDMYRDIGVEIPMPAEIDGYKVIHQITWKDALDYIPLRMPYSDPDAAGGHAIKADDKATGYSGFCFGYYIEKAEKYVQEINNYPKEKIPQDGKYHYYKVGKVTLEESGYFHSHASWTAQWFTDHLLVPGGDNDYIAYISLKCTGPAYVKGSQDKTSAIWSDRVLLVREK